MMPSAALPSHDSNILAELPARKHRWDRDRTTHLAAAEFADSNGRTFRPCVLCNMVRITVHGGDGKSFWREWRTRDGELWVGEATPPCLDAPSLDGMVKL